MLNQHDIIQTIRMIDKQHLDIRTITMGISLRDCAHSALYRREIRLNILYFHFQVYKIHFARLPTSQASNSAKNWP